jgi:hypothetical protein
LGFGWVNVNILSGKPTCEKWGKGIWHGGCLSVRTGRIAASERDGEVLRVVPALPHPYLMVEVMNMVNMVNMAYTVNISEFR